MNRERMRKHEFVFAPFPNARKQTLLCHSKHSLNYIMKVTKPFYIVFNTTMCDDAIALYSFLIPTFIE